MLVKKIRVDLMLFNNVDKTPYETECLEHYALGMTGCKRNTAIYSISKVKIKKKYPYIIVNSRHNNIYRSPNHKI